MSIGDEAGAERLPTRGLGVGRRASELLRKSTLGVVKAALISYLIREREFIELFFPRIAERGYVTFQDVLDLTLEQVDALRPIMAESIHYFRKQDGRDKNRGVNLLTRLSEDANAFSYHAKKAKLWTEALQDLCSVYGLESPI